MRAVHTFGEPTAVVDHLFVVQRLLIKSVKNVSDKYASVLHLIFLLGVLLC